MAIPRRGRKVKAPQTELGAFIQKRLETMGLTRTELAKKLGVSTPTIVRMLNGDTKVVHSQQINFDSISNILGLDEMDRRKFLKIVSAAGFALATGAKAPYTLKYKIDLDLADDHAQTLQRLFTYGDDPQHILHSTKTWYEKLMNHSSYTKDVRLATTQIRFGLLLGSVQEVTLPWYERPRAIQTYNTIENDIICRFNLKLFEQEYAMLHSRRAPLYRDFHNYAESKKQFDDGKYWSRSVDNPALRIALFDHVHISATLGKETLWHKQLEEAQTEAQTMNHQFRAAALSELSYLEAEGYKRLAFNTQKEIPRQVRMHYAQKALQSFSYSQVLMDQYAQTYNSIAQLTTEQTTMGHKLLAQVSQAQCLALVDPEESIHLLQHIWNDTSKYYPALIAKMQRTLHVAQGQQSANKMNPLILFAL